jgi:hypothetical protein
MLDVGRFVLGSKELDVNQETLAFEETRERSSEPVKGAPASD